MNTLHKENKLSELGNTVNLCYKEKGADSLEFEKIAKEYCEQIISLVPYHIKEGFLKSRGAPCDNISEVHTLTPFKFVGVITYAVSPGDFEKSFREKYNKEPDMKKYFTIQLPVREKETTGGSYSVGIFELI
jgi:hypothetical protein